MQMDKQILRASSGCLLFAITTKQGWLSLGEGEEKEMTSFRTGSVLFCCSSESLVQRKVGTR